MRDNGRFWKSTCRECDNRIAREYRKRNQEKRKQHYFENRETILEANRQSYYKNKAKRKAKQKEWYENNKAERIKSIAKWRENNKDKWKQIRRRWERGRRTENPVKVVSERISASIRRYLRDGRKGDSWRRYVDFTPEELKSHLESLFKPGMSWGNRGEWHIDHIRPVSSFSFQSMDDPEFKKCWCLDNLQPLWAKDNIVKSNHYANA